MAAKPQRAGKLSAARPRRLKKAVRKMDGVPPLLSKEWKNLPFGSPKKWMALAGMITPEEGELIRAAVREFDKVEGED